VGTEACDDRGSTNAGDGSSDTCTVESGYTCTNDDGVDQASTCAATSCGDGVVTGLEECDDGNLESKDGCSSSCVIEWGWNCSRLVCGQSSCNEVCGNTIKTPGEGCDDGNSDDLDGCSHSCIVECGFVCDGAEPQICVSECGDGILASDEACDNKDTANDDGCSSTCTKEARLGCTKTTYRQTSCTAICGDGLKVGNEACDGEDRSNQPWNRAKLFDLPFPQYTHIYMCACIYLHIKIWKYRCEHVQNNQLTHKDIHLTFYQSCH